MADDVVRAAGGNSRHCAADNSLTREKGPAICRKLMGSLIPGSVMRLVEQDWVREYLVWPTIASVFLVGAAAVLIYPWFGEVSFATSDGSLAFSALFAAGTVGWTTWVLVSRFGTGYEPADGAIAGAITGVFAHPVMWFLWPLLPPNYVSAEKAVFMAMIMPFASVYSLLFVGWITAPLGSIGGVAAGLLQRLVRKRAGNGSAGADGLDTTDGDQVADGDE